MRPVSAQLRAYRRISFRQAPPPTSAVAEGKLPNSNSLGDNYAGDNYAPSNLENSACYLAILMLAKAMIGDILLLRHIKSVYIGAPQRSHANMSLKYDTDMPERARANCSLDSEPIACYAARLESLSPGQTTKLKPP